MLDWKRSALAASAMIAAIAVGNTAQAKDINFAIGFGPEAAGTKAYQTFAKNVEEWSGGELKTKVYPLSLLSLKETPPGLRDGLADVGVVFTTYFPKEFAHTNLIAALSLLSSLKPDVEPAAPVFSGAASEYLMFNCPKCQEEFKQQNQVYLGDGTSTAFMLLCTRPVTTIEELKGMRLRSPSATYSRWAEKFGAVTVSIPGNEIYEALAQGVVDCTMSPATQLTDFQLFDVVSDLTVNVPGGVYGGAALANVNLDTWQGLTDEQRKIFFKAAAYNHADAMWYYHTAAARDLEVAKEKGIAVHQSDAELFRQSVGHVESDLETIIETYRAQYGVENAAEMVEEFRPLIDKWSALVSKVNSREDLRALYYDEIFSKLEPDYGM